MSLISILFTVFFYLAVSLCLVGVTLKVIQYASTPAPLKIPIAPAPLTRFGVILRMTREVFLFSSLFRASRWTWLFGWLFHWALVLLFIRHLPYFWPGETPELLNQVAPLKYAAFPLIFGLIGLLGRRLCVERVRYISAPSDYLLLLLLIAIALTGALMTFAYYYPDMGKVYGFAEGLVTLNWTELPTEGVFLAHIFMVFVLIAIFPISKMLHAPGVFFSPTLNQTDDARKKRHIAPWAINKEKSGKGG
ncbi:MAG: respiratory nitrate reductase subunit gamma [Gammaproteobacteria bacterium]|nr:respiratory nitrate reductase subunit gamma [Gammaproteobacteria bacterium]